MALKFTPTTGFSGTDSFSCLANDGTLDSAAITINVTASNRAPVAVDDATSKRKRTRGTKPITINRLQTKI